jgi:tripartite-type tricarboxylate transporter receptor subunit TctC
MAPGDATDVVGRLSAEALSNLLKVPVMPLNKAGAGGTLGVDTVAKAKKDGYTLLVASSSPIINLKVLGLETVPYDPFKDLTPLGLHDNGSFLIAVRKGSPYKNLQELVEYAKKNPKKVRCGTAGSMTIADLNVELLRMLTGADMTRVPFKGASPSVAALLGGHVDAVSTSYTALLGSLRSGDAIGLAISGNLPEFPNIPTLTQLGYKRNLIVVWCGFFAPEGVPREVTDALVPAIEKVVRDPKLSSKFAESGIFVEYLSPENLSIRMREEYKMLEEIAREVKLVK